MVFALHSGNASLFDGFQCGRFWHHRAVFLERDGRFGHEKCDIRRTGGVCAGEDRGESERTEVCSHKEDFEAPAQEKSRFIENPLPLPKKHVKRTMDYDYEIAEEDMHYDVETAAEDDFEE